MADPIEQGARWPLDITQGATFSNTFLYKNEDGTPIDLTGYTAKGQIRAKEDPEATLYADFTCAVDGPGGSLTISLTADETSAIPASGFYDVFLVQGASRFLFLQGAVRLDKRVTQFS
jgi:hypothetical protein